MNEVEVFFVAFRIGLLNFLEDGADGIGHFQQGVGDFRRQRQIAGAHHRQQVLSRVGNLLELGKTQEAARSLDGVNRSEDAA